MARPSFRTLARAHRLFGGRGPTAVRRYQGGSHTRGDVSITLASNPAPGSARGAGRRRLCLQRLSLRHAPDRRRRARRHHVAAGLPHHRLRRRRAERAPDGARASRRRVRRLALARARCTRSSTATATHAPTRCTWSPAGSTAERRRVPRRRALRRRGEPHPALRTSRATSAHPPSPWSSPTPIRPTRITAGSSSRFGPDGRLYVPVGAPCNVCDAAGPLHAHDHAHRPAGGRPEMVARGVRNSVGFDWHPGNGELWFTDNGRDWLGDDQPPDELNHAPRPGEHFGFPYCHGDGIARSRAQRAAAPAASSRRRRASSARTWPRSACASTPAAMFPEKYRGGIFIAEHGSWNRSTPIGYRVTFVKIEGGRAVAYEPFAEGWLQGGDGVGAPGRRARDARRRAARLRRQGRPHLPHHLRRKRLIPRQKPRPGTMGAGSI